jgi:hypothetical protein
MPLIADETEQGLLFKDIVPGKKFSRNRFSLSLLRRLNAVF